ncbi:MAG: TIGR02186 family protein [Hyphomicrobiaceae bacterium]|nr:TIGR02186 family protein [Hyphomicrobiaceae bacterium]
MRGGGLMPYGWNLAQLLGVGMLLTFTAIVASDAALAARAEIDATQRRQVMAQVQAQAQRKRTGPAPNVAKEAPLGHAGEAKREQRPGVKESVQADVSARNVAVTSSFNGTEIVIFGAVDNSQQPSAESGYYDVVIVVEGVPGRIVARRKNNVAGLWLNTSAAVFDLVPSYYAVASTRPLDEIVPDDYRALHGIGFRHLRFRPAPAVSQQYALSTEDLNAFREAIVRLKQKQGLYVNDNFGVSFIGRSLFRASIVLPANVTVGPFETRVMLFREEKLLSQYSVRLNLEREGAERYLHGFAVNYPALYGVATVVIAIAAGLLASALFRRANA